MFWALLWPIAVSSLIALFPVRASCHIRKGHGRRDDVHKWQLRMAMGGNSTKMSLLLPEEALTTFSERPAFPESTGYGGCGRKLPEGHLTVTKAITGSGGS